MTLDFKEDFSRKRNLYRNSAKIVQQRIELLQERDLYQNGIDNKDNEHLKRLDQEIVKMNLILRVTTDFSHFIYLNHNHIEDIVDAIAQLLLESHVPLFEDIFVYCMIMYRLNLSEHFVNQIVYSLEQFQTVEDYRIFDLVSLARVEAIILEKAEVVDKLTEFLKTHNRLPKPSESENSTQERILTTNLSKTGKIMFESAESSYYQALIDDFEWKDAGMISLGYFRILEVEINEKIVLPLIYALDIEELEKTYERISDKLSKKYKDRWKSTIRVFKKIKSKDEFPNYTGLMLGSIEQLFGWIKADGMKEKNRDYRLKKIIYDTVLSLVTYPVGVERIEAGEISHMVRDEIRSQYRNPPAHTSYLPFSIAKEARKYVLENLIKILEIAKD